MAEDDHSSHSQKKVVFSQISAGNGRSAAVSSEKGVFLWGARLQHYPKEVPRRFLDEMAVKQVQCGGDGGRAVSAILTEDGRLWTTGDCLSGKVGGGRQPLPERVSLGGRVSSVICGLGMHLMVMVDAEG